MGGFEWGTENGEGEWGREEGLRGNWTFGLWIEGR